MVLVTPGLALILFGIILIVAGGVAWYMRNYANYDKGTFHTFIAILGGLGVFVTFLFYYNLIELQNQQQLIAAREEIARLSDSVLNSVLNEIKVASNIIPNFVLSITPLSNNVCCFPGGTGLTGITGLTGCDIPVNEDPVNPQTCTEKMVLSYRIFNLWQDVITSNVTINFDPTPYVSNFLQRANSSQLLAQWTAARIDFDSVTQQFGDLLFEYGIPIVIQTPEEYVRVAKELINDPRFKTLIGG